MPGVRGAVTVWRPALREKLQADTASAVHFGQSVRSTHARGGASDRVARMASRTLSKLAPFRSTSFAPLALLLVVGACGEEKNGAEGNVPVEPSSSVDPSATTDQQPTGAP